MSEDLRNLERRLVRLETENRRLRRGVLSALLALACGALMIAARETPRRLEAESFVVRDEMGTVRATFGMHPNGFVGLVVPGDVRVAVGTSPEGTGLFLHDESAHRRGELALHDGGAIGLELKASGKTRAALRLRPDNVVALGLGDKEGIERTSLVVLGDESGGLLLSDATGKVRTALARQVDGASSLSFMDEANKTRADVGIRAAGAPFLDLLEKTGQALFRKPDGNGAGGAALK